MKTNKIFLAGCMLIIFTTGWLLGSITTNAFSQSATQKHNAVSSNSESVNLPSISMNGETLPTIILSEFSVVVQ